MSARTVIDSVDFAQTAQELHGTVALASLSRLKESSLPETEGSLRYALKGSSDGQGRFFLSIEIKGVLPLRCQRCLETMTYPLRVISALRLVRQTEAQSAGDDDPLAPDCIEARHDLDIVELLEEEILLALPYAPKHDDKACRKASYDRDPAGTRAFAVLADLKKLKS
jgi:uncharacterized protein